MAKFVTRDAVGAYQLPHTSRSRGEDSGAYSVKTGETEMGRSATTLWCPKCKEHRPCRSLSDREADDYLSTRRGPRFYMPGHDDLQYFSRVRECEQCGEDFQTAEVESTFLDELVKLRTALAEIKLSAAAHVKDTKETARQLNDLAKWLVALQSLQ